MATLTVPSPPKSPMPLGPKEAGDTSQLVPCLHDSKIKRAIELGDEHRAIGDFENAWTAYTTAMVYWLRLQWMSHKNSAKCPIAGPEALSQKLRAALLIDTWTFTAIRSIVRRPTPVGWLQVDIVAGIVKAICNVA